MRIDHVRFCVEDAKAVSQWLCRRLGFRRRGSGWWQGCQVEWVAAGAVQFVVCAPGASTSFAAQFLRRYAAGVADVVFQVGNLEQAIAQATANGATLLQPLQVDQQPHGQLKWATIAAWGSLTHTLVERHGQTTLLPQMAGLQSAWPPLEGPEATHSPTEPAAPQTIDHVVLNVGPGGLAGAVTWYEQVFGFQPDQGFVIQTEYSALHSRVMRHPSGHIQMPINEPASPNSQIQEFLEHHRGPGIQHIALHTQDLLTAIAQFRKAGLPLITVPEHYYHQLRDRPACPVSPATLNQLAENQLLIDWQADPNTGVLLQTFTKPVFRQPTFFFELIERQAHPAALEPVLAQGFGEGNFRALFEAIEQEQMKRGSLAQTKGDG